MMNDRKQCVLQERKELGSEGYSEDFRGRISANAWSGLAQLLFLVDAFVAWRWYFTGEIEYACYTAIQLCRDRGATT